jgi:comEA protein
MDRLVIAAMTALVLFGGFPLAAQSPAKKPAAAQAVVVNLNTATAAEIAVLPGIGIKTAELIVQYRQKNGGFKKIEEIMNVRGVGEKSFLKLKSLITITPPNPESK